MIPRCVTILALTLAGALQADVIAPGAQPLTVVVSGETLSIAPPDYTDETKTFPAPADYQPHLDNWLPWPRPNAKRKTHGAITFAPSSDEHGVLMLGLPFRQYPAEFIVVKSPNGKAFQEGVDYKLLADYGQIMAIDGKLGKIDEDKVVVSYREVPQRLDLIQVDSSGKVTVKQGESRFVCPYLPEPDVGHTAVAGVYVAPWLDANSQLTADLILPINPADPVAPVNADAVAKTRAKLEQGKPVSIAYMGDSLTLGAEAGKWWEDNTKHWRGRFQNELKARYPESDISEIAAWRGGKGTEFGLEVLQEVVLPAKPDLLIVMMGVNDADGPSTDGSKAKVPAPTYGQHLENIIKSAQDAGIEVILMTSMQPYPMKPGGHAQRWPDYVEQQKQLAEKYHVGLADTYAEWLNLQTRGIPPYSQLHNWNNHPGAFGHGVMADVPLRFFPGN